jgi:hypothetical protein
MGECPLPGLELTGEEVTGAGRGIELRCCASSRLSASILVIPRSSPPTSDLKLAPSWDPTFRDRTVIPKTSPSTSVTSYPGRSFMVLRIIPFLPW